MRRKGLHLSGRIRIKCLEGWRAGGDPRPRWAGGLVGGLVGDQKEEPEAPHNHPPGRDRGLAPEGRRNREDEKSLEDSPRQSRQADCDLAERGQEQEGHAPQVDNVIVPREARGHSHRPEDDPHANDGGEPPEPESDAPLQGGENEPDSRHDGARAPDTEPEKQPARHEADDGGPEHPAAGHLTGCAGRRAAAEHLTEPFHQARLGLFPDRGAVGHVVVLEPGRRGVGISASAAPRGGEKRGGEESHQDVAEQGGVTAHVSLLGALRAVKSLENGPTC